MTLLARRESWRNLRATGSRGAGARKVKDARIIGRAIDVTFELLRKRLPRMRLRVSFVRQMLQRENPAAVISDLPEADVEAVAAHGRHGAALFDIRHRGGGLRRKTCRSNLFHVMPSDAMLNDALAQYLKSVGWDEIQVLTSGSPPTWPNPNPSSHRPASSA
jgi:hypothetical protein